MFIRWETFSQDGGNPARAREDLGRGGSSSQSSGCRGASAATRGAPRCLPLSPAGPLSRFSEISRRLAVIENTSEKRELSEPVSKRSTLAKSPECYKAETTTRFTRLPFGKIRPGNFISSRRVCGNNLNFKKRYSRRRVSTSTKRDSATTASVEPGPAPARGAAADFPALPVPWGLFSLSLFPSLRPTGSART